MTVASENISQLVPDVRFFLDDVGLDLPLQLRRHVRGQA